MKPQVPWLRVFVEGVVIVGSILLAFAIDAWWEERQDRSVEEALLTGLIEDLRRDSADYAGFARVHDDRVRAADFLLALGGERASASAGPTVAITEMTAGQAFRLIGRFARLETVRVSYDQITAAGISDVMSDPELRRMIARYYAAAEDADDVNDFQDAVSQRLELGLREFGYVTADGDGIPAGVLSDDRLRADIRTVRNASRGASARGTRRLQLATDLIRAIEESTR